MEHDLEALSEMFNAEIQEKSSLIDPGGNEDWHSLALGWALGKGLDPEAALDFALRATYA